MMTTEIKTLQQINREFSDECKPAGSRNSASPNNKKKPSRKKPVYAKYVPLWKDLLYLAIKIAAIFVVFVLAFTFVFGIMRYDEPSMEPSIKDGDLVIFHRYTKTGYLPRDTIVLVVDGKQQVRRVVATAGDTVDITESGLLINGALQQEPEIQQKTERYTEGVEFPLTVPEGHVFVLGDSRTGAEDSRIYGCVRIEATLGKVMTVIRRRGI